MRRLLMMVGLLLLVLLPGNMAAAQDGANDAAVQKAVAYIQTQQNADGTFQGFDAGSTADAIYALSAANVNVAEFKNGQTSAVDGLVKLAPEAVKEPGTAAKFVLAALLAGQNPRALGDSDLVAAVENSFDTAKGQYGKDLTSHALALLALGAAGATLKPEAVTALEKLQLPDGGWSFDGAAATGSDTNTTAVALQALVAAGSTGDAKTRASDYLRAQQNSDGGFPYSQTSQFGNASDANSTALSIQAILAAGETLDKWAKDGKTPLDRLLAFQNASGAFRFQDAQAEDNAFATYQAVPAVARKTFPLEPILITQEGSPADATATMPIPAEDVTATTGPTAATTATAGPATTVEAATAAPTAAGAEPGRLPDTGGNSLPVMFVLAVGLLLVATGLVLGRRRA